MAFTETTVLFIPQPHLKVNVDPRGKCTSNQMERNFLSQKPSRMSRIDAFNLIFWFYKKKEKKNRPAMPDIKSPGCFFVAMGYEGKWKHPWHFHLSPVATALSHSTEKVNSSGCVAHFSWLFRNDHHCSPETLNLPHGLHSEYKCYLIYLLNTCRNVLNWSYWRINGREKGLSIQA